MHFADLVPASFYSNPSLGIQRTLSSTSRPWNSSNQRELGPLDLDSSVLLSLPCVVRLGVRHEICVT